MSGEVFGIIGAIAGTIVGFILERIRDCISEKKKKKINQKVAKMLVKEFLYNEIESNDLQLREKKFFNGTESMLTVIQKEMSNVHIDKGKDLFSITCWELIRAKTIDLDEDIAAKVNRLYHYYEVLISFSGMASEFSKVKLENFKNYENDYDRIMNLLN